MAALLIRNNANGKPMEHAVLGDVRGSEKVNCTAFPDCLISYTLAYGQTEDRMVGGANNIATMRRQAGELVRGGHPHVLTDDCYVWNGPKLGWLDKKAADVAGL